MKQKMFFCLLAFFTVFTVQGQEAFSMHYECYKVFTPTGGKKPDGSNKGFWSGVKNTQLTVDFSVGVNKDIIIHENGGTKLYVKKGDPFMGQTPHGMRYQLIVAKYRGKLYTFQYLENYNFRIINTDNFSMIEYSCASEVN